MAKIQGITTNNISFGASIYNTKRQFMDGSEAYVRSKLVRLYNQAVADYFVNSKLEYIKKFANENGEG